MLAILQHGYMFNMANKKVNGNSGCINNNVESRIRKAIVLLFSEFVEPHLRYCAQLWQLSFKEGQRQNRG